MKHEVKSIPAEEILANRCNAYQFIDFDKQETLEEAGEKLYPNRESFLYRFQNIERKAFTEGAKWQQERSYSEEDIALAFNEGQAYSVTGKLVDGKEWVKAHKKEWFEQFKKK